MQTSVAVVTGASSGIGRAIALQLARDGFDVVVHAGSRIERAEATAAEIRQGGRQAWTVLCDFQQSDSALSEFVEQVFSLAPNVRCWINNAGGDVLTGARAKTSFAEKLEYLWRVDVRATLLLSRLVAQRWREIAETGAQENHTRENSNAEKIAAPIGSIVNMGWDQANSGLPGESGQMFACTKGSIMAMTAALAQSYAPQVRVNCVAPGWIQTQWGQQADTAWDEWVSGQSLLQRWGRPEDVAAAVSFLVSSHAEFVNGHCLPVGGGLNIAPPELKQRLMPERKASPL